MIGVVANQNDLDVVREFFELFKTPWEQAEPGRKYRIVLSASEGIEGIDAQRFLEQNT